MIDGDVLHGLPSKVPILESKRGKKIKLIKRNISKSPYMSLLLHVAAAFSLFWELVFTLSLFHL